MHPNRHHGAPGFESSTSRYLEAKNKVNLDASDWFNHMQHRDLCNPLCLRKLGVERLFTYSVEFVYLNHRV